MKLVLLEQMSEDKTGNVIFFRCGFTGVKDIPTKHDQCSQHIHYEILIRYSVETRAMHFPQRLHYRKKNILQFWDNEFQSFHEIFNNFLVR